MEEMKSLLDAKNNLNVRRTIGFYLKSSWYFETFLEKAILLGLGGLGMLRIFQWVF